jgi:hypothetical protein
MDPPLTTIAQPMREIGEGTVRMLVDILAGRTIAPFRSLFPTRWSCDRYRPGARLTLGCPGFRHLRPRQSTNGFSRQFQQIGARRVLTSVPRML